MRAFITSLFIILLASQTLSASINEYKTDLYFANGVGAVTKETSFYQGSYQYDSYLIANPNSNKDIGKFDLSYNTGHGVLLDKFESWLQYTDENPTLGMGWSAFKEILGRKTAIGASAVELLESVTLYYESQDIAKQVSAYKKSILEGHGVLVLAHAEGNFFTNKAYKSDGGIDSWMREYFRTVGLASPSDVKIPHSNYVTYDNDPIALLNGAGRIVKNPTRSYFTNAIGEQVEENYNNKFHTFDYYMETTATQTDIYTYINNAIEFQKSIFVPSQWETDKELNKGTKEYRIKLKHKYDSTILSMDGVEVYPFNTEKKLYAVNEEYVKASYGGSKVLDYWDGKQDNEIYLIDNSQKEKIFIKDIEGFKFKIKYKLKYSGSYWNRSMDYEYIKPDSTCDFYISGSGSNYHRSPTNIEAELFNERNDYERYYVNGNYHRFIKCMINENGYQISDIKDVSRGDEKVSLFGYTGLLEQEYIVTPIQ